MIFTLLLTLALAADPGGDFVLFSGPGPAARARAFAPLGGLLAREKEKGAKLLCLDGTWPAGKDEPWATLRKRTAPEIALPGLLPQNASGEGLPFLCANLCDPSGKRPFPAARKVGAFTFCGAVGSGFAVPKGWKVLSRDEVKGIEAQVLLFRGAEEEALEWARASGAKIILLAAPFLRREPLHVGSFTLVYVPLWGRNAVRLSLEGKDAPRVGAVTPLSPPPGIPEEMRALLDIEYKCFKVFLIQTVI